MELNTGINPKDAKAVTELLNSILSKEFALYTKTRNFHWSVTGPNFIALHEFFDDQYNSLNQSVDDIAERARSIGGRPNLTRASNHSALKEEVKPLNAKEMLEALLTDHEAVIRELRVGVKDCQRHGDEGTASFLTGLMEKHEKMAWMLRAHLET